MNDKQEEVIVTIQDFTISSIAFLEVAVWFIVLFKPTGFIPYYNAVVGFLLATSFICNLAGVIMIKTKREIRMLNPRYLICGSFMADLISIFITSVNSSPDPAKMIKLLEFVFWSTFGITVLIFTIPSSFYRDSTDLSLTSLSSRTFQQVQKEYKAMMRTTVFWMFTVMFSSTFDKAFLDSKFICQMPSMNNILLIMIVLGCGAMISHKTSLERNKLALRLVRILKGCMMFALSIRVFRAAIRVGGRVFPTKM